MVKTGEVVPLYYDPGFNGESFYGAQADGGARHPAVPGILREDQGRKAQPASCGTCISQASPSTPRCSGCWCCRPGAPQAAVDTLRAAVLRLNNDKTFAEDAQKVVGFVPEYSAASDTNRQVSNALTVSPEMRAAVAEYIKNGRRNREECHAAQAARLRRRCRCRCNSGGRIVRSPRRGPILQGQAAHASHQLRARRTNRHRRPAVCAPHRQAYRRQSERHGAEQGRRRRRGRRRSISASLGRRTAPWSAISPARHGTMSSIRKCSGSISGPISSSAISPAMPFITCAPIRRPACTTGRTS